MPDHLPYFKPDQLVIDRTQRDVVLSALNALEITATPVDEIADFDLELLELEYRADHPRIDAAPVTDLDAVLAELRRPYEEADPAEDPPFLAKNRTVTSRFGAYPETQSHTDFDPAALDNEPDDDMTGTAGTGVRIGVLDTKLVDHDKLRGRVELPNGASTRLPYPDRPHKSYLPQWEEGHGTFVVGCIATRAPGARIVVRDVLDHQGEASTWATVKEMANFLHDSIDILVLAIGCRTDDQKAPKTVLRAIERLNDKMLIIAAAGNHGATKGMKNGITRQSATWPAAIEGVIAVGATKPDGSRADYSPDLPWVYCTGPGDDVESIYLTGDVRLRGGNTVKFNGSARWRGTSFSAAALGGAIAAAMQVERLDARAALEHVLGQNGEFRRNS